jgi:acetoin utilization deacetylase AcuC-like enzyme
MRVAYHPRYAALSLPGHVFPVEKYRRTLDRLMGEGIVRAADVVAPTPPSWEDLARVHDPDYLEDLRRARRTPRTAFSELPLDRDLVDGFVLMAGGTLAACRAALADGVAANIGGGFHHAKRDRAEGFCYVNDLACALAVLLAEGAVRRPAVVDCDLHQGNGTAEIFAGREEVFTFSIHEEGIYPVPKSRSRLDVGLASFTGDAEYLERLGGALATITSSHRPDFILYQAGADPFAEDELGNLRLTFDGLSRRDRLVLEAARGRGIPLAVTLGGGYAPRVEDTVAIHVETIRLAAEGARRK